MTATRYIARAKDIAARMIGGEMMIMSGRDSSLFSLNSTASILWQAADGVTRLDAIVERDICSAFDVAPAVALRDAEELVTALSGHGILLTSDSPIVVSATPLKPSP